MSKATVGRFLALSSAAVLASWSVGTAAQAASGSGSADHGKHLGQAKHASVTAPPTAAPTTAPSTARPAGKSKAVKSTGKTTNSPQLKSTSNGGANAPATRGQGAGPGNNGTVKIAPVGDMDRIPNNSPHPGCDFEVQWYGFDAGSDVVSTVTFTPQAPTKDVSISVNGPQQVPVGQDAASGAGTSTGLDAVQNYTLSFSGEAPAKQGYHVRLTVATPRSQGNDTKTKVFWVQSCTAASPTASTAPSVATSPQAKVGAAANRPQTHTRAGSVTTKRRGTPTTISARSAQIAARRHNGTKPSSAAAAAVPTAVDAGENAAGFSTGADSPWPPAAIVLGLLVSAVGARRLRRRA